MIMRYLLALVLPPLGMLLAGKRFQAILCVLLMITVIGWPIASIWALCVVAEEGANARNNKLIRAMRR
jgi:uncharacterized membrane protein YqaE (UPF0057 family)